MTEAHTPYEQLHLRESRIIGAHQPPGVAPEEELYDRLTWLLSLQGDPRQYTLTIESQSAHDRAVLEQAGEQAGEQEEQADDDIEPVLLMPGRTFSAAGAKAVLGWPFSILERYLVIQEPASPDVAPLNNPVPPMDKRLMHAARLLIEQQPGDATGSSDA